MNTAYKPTEKGQKLAQKALSKMLIYFMDGNCRTFYSRDLKKGHQVPDRNIGIARLKKYALGNKNYIQTAVIYDNTNGAEMYKFRGGHWV